VKLEASKNFLMAVLNEAMMHGRNRITVRADLLDMDILRIDLDRRRIRDIASREDFDPVISEIRMKLGNGRMEDDLPGWYDLRDAFWSSLIILPRDFDLLVDEFRDIERRRLDPYRYPKQMMLAIDTNIAYDRLLTRMTLMEEMCGKRGIDPSKIPVIVPSLVKEEVTRIIGHKYRSNEIDELERALGTRLPNLYNCLGRRGRKSANAQAEINIIEEKYSYLSASGGRFTDDKEQRDLEIVKSVHDLARAQDCQVLFLTADDKAMAHCNAFKVPSRRVRYEYDLPGSIEYDPWMLVELIHDIAINFASIQLRGLGVRIQGAWAGKSICDYTKERLCFHIQSGSDISNDLERDHRILCGMRESLDLDHII
jgi:hypothetical protein